MALVVLSKPFLNILIYLSKKIHILKGESGKWRKTFKDENSNNLTTFTNKIYFKFR